MFFVLKSNSSGELIIYFGNEDSFPNISNPSIFPSSQIFSKRDRPNPSLLIPISHSISACCCTTQTRPPPGSTQCCRRSTLPHPSYIQCSQLAHSVLAASRCSALGSYRHGHYLIICQIFLQMELLLYCM